MPNKKQLLTDFYAKYAPDVELSEERLQAIETKYGNDNKKLLQDFYGKYAPNVELTEERYTAINNKYKLDSSGGAETNFTEGSEEPQEQPSQPSRENLSPEDDYAKNFADKDTFKNFNELQKQSKKARVDLGSYESMAKNPDLIGKRGYDEIVAGVETNKQKATDISKDIKKQQQYIDKIINDEIEVDDTFIQQGATKQGLNRNKIYETAEAFVAERGLTKDDPAYEYVVSKLEEKASYQLVKPFVEAEFKSLVAQDEKFKEVENKTTELKSMLSGINAKYEVEAKQATKPLREEYEQGVAVLGEQINKELELTLAPDVEELANKYKQVVESGALPLEDAQKQLQTDIEALYKEGYESAAKLHESDANKLYEDFLGNVAQVNNRINQSARREQEKSIAEFEKYVTSLNLDEKQEELFKQAYVNASEKVSQLNISREASMPMLYNMTANTISSLFDGIAGLATSMGATGLKENATALVETIRTEPESLEEISDLFDRRKFEKSFGNLLGRMTPALAAGFATGGVASVLGASSMGTMLAGSFGAFTTETADMAATLGNDVFAETGDAGIAKAAQSEMWRGQLMNMPLYTFEMLPYFKLGASVFKGSSKLGKITRVPKAAATGFLTELPQEFTQGSMEEAIKKSAIETGTPSISGATEFMTLERLGETALEIAPVTLLGGGGQAVSQTREEISKRKGMAIAQKENFATLVPEAQEQFLFDVVTDNSANTAKGVLAFAGINGLIDEQTLSDLSTKVEEMEGTKSLLARMGIKGKDAKIAYPLYQELEGKMQELQEAKGTPLEAALKQEVKDLQENFDNFLLGSDANYMVVTFADGTSRAVTFKNAEEFLTQNKDAIINGDMSVDIRGTKLIEMATPILETPAESQVTPSQTDTESQAIPLQEEEGVGQVLENKSKFNDVSSLVGKKQPINENTLQEGIDEAYTALEELEGNTSEDANIMRELIEDEIQKLENYDNTTTIETRKIAEERTRTVSKKTPRKTIPRKEKEFVGKKAKFRDNKGGGGQGVITVVKTPDGKEYYVLQSEAPKEVVGARTKGGDVIRKVAKIESLEEKTILGETDKVFEQGQVNTDKDGNAVSVTFPMSDGKQITIENPEIAEQVIQEQTIQQEFDESVFEEVYIEFVGEEQVEVKKPKTETTSKQEQSGAKQNQPKQTTAKSVTAEEKTQIAEAIGNVRKVKPKNIKGLLGVMSNMFGLDKQKAEASAVVGDVMVGNMAKRAGVTKDEMYQRVAFQKTLMEDLPQGVKFQLNAWHASPYMFDKFSLDYQGKGVGAARSGIGIYFAVNKKDAEGYAKRFSDNTLRIGDIEIKEKSQYYPKEFFKNLKDAFDKSKGSRLSFAKDLLKISKQKREEGIKERESFIKLFLEKGKLTQQQVEEYDFDLPYYIQDYFDESFQYKKFAKESLKKGVDEGNIPAYLYVVSIKENGNWLNFKENMTDEQYEDILAQAVKENSPYLKEIKKQGKGKNNREFYWNVGNSVPTNEKALSELLMRAGIDGNIGLEDVNMQEYVVFDEDAVSIEEVIKFQKDAEKARGAMMMAMDNQAIIYALSDPNVSTPLHELAHVYEHYLRAAEKKIIQDWAGTKEWTVETSEKFARGFEKYLAEGKAPTLALQKYFDNFKKWLTEIYNGIVGSEIDIELNEPMRKIYAKMVTPIKTVPTVESETKGLPKKDVVKQGVEEIVQGYKEKVKDVTKKLTQKIQDTKADAKDKLETIKQAKAQVTQLIEDSLPKNIKIPKGLAKKLVNAKTDKQIAGVSQQLVNYVERAQKREAINEIKEKARAVAKKLPQLTNQSEVINNLINTDLRKIDNQELLDEISQELDNILKEEVAKVNPEKIEEILAKVEKREKASRFIKPEDVEKRIEKAKAKDTAYEKAKALDRILTDIERTYLDKESGFTKEEFEDAVKEIETELANEKEFSLEEAQELNQDSVERLKTLNEAPYTALQKEEIRRLKAEAGKRKDYKNAVKLNDIVTELELGFIPIKQMAEYVRDAKSEVDATVLSTKINDRKNFRGIKDRIATVFGLGKEGKVRGKNDRVLADALDILLRDAILTWDDLFGLGKTKDFSVRISAPIDSAIATAARKIKDLQNEYSRIRYGFRPVKDDVAVGITMARKQGDWEVTEGNDTDYWGMLLDPDNPAMAKERGKYPHKELEGIERVYKKLPKKDGKVDYSKYLGELKGDAKKLNDFYTRVAEEFSELQEIANQRRGQEFVKRNSTFYQTDIVYKGNTIIDSDSRFNAFMDMATNQPYVSTEAAIGTTRVKRTTPIPISVNPDAIFTRQITQTLRDYYLTPELQTAQKTIGKAEARVKDKDAKALLSQAPEALKTMVGIEYGMGARPNRIVANLLNAARTYFLSGVSRVVAVEMVAEGIRMIGAVQKRQVPKAIFQMIAGGRLTSTSFLPKLLETVQSTTLEKVYLEAAAPDATGTIQTNKRALSKTAEKISILASNYIGLSSRVYFPVLWLPEFNTAFKLESGKDFNAKEFMENPDYVKENKEAMQNAARFADTRVSQVQGGRTRFSRRAKQAWVGTPILNLIDKLSGDITTSQTSNWKYLDSTSTLGILNGFLSQFMFIEGKTIVKGIVGTLFGENMTRSRGGQAVIFGFMSGLSYLMMQDVVKNIFNKVEGEDEDVFDVDKIIENIIANASGLITGKYGQSAKLALLAGLGFWSNTTKDKKVKEEINKIAKDRFRSYPLEFGYGNITRASDAIIPFSGEVIRTLSEGVDVTSDKELEMALRVAALTNDVFKLAMLSQGTQAPWQRYSDVAIRGLIKIERGEKITAYEYEVLDNLGFIGYIDEIISSDRVRVKKSKGSTNSYDEMFKTTK